MKGAKEIIDDAESLGIAIRWAPDTDVRCYPQDQVAKELLFSVMAEIKEYVDLLRSYLMAQYAVRFVN